MMAKAGPGRGLIWVQGLACGGFVALAPAASLLLGVLLAPAIAALLLDRAPGRPIARAMLLCGASGCVGPVTTVWDLGVHDAAASVAMLSDPGVLALSWSAAAGGWLFSQILPIGVRAVLEAISLSRAARLRAERDRLIQAWGLDDQ